MNIIWTERIPNLSVYLFYLYLVSLSFSLHLSRIGARRTPIQVKSKHQKVMLVHRNWNAAFTLGGNESREKKNNNNQPIAALGEERHARRRGFFAFYFYCI